MDYERWKLYFDIGQLVLTVLVWLYVWLSQRDRVTNRRFIVLEKELLKRMEDMRDSMDIRMGSMREDVNTRLGSHSNRITRLETVCDKAPNHQDLGLVYSDMKAIGSKVDDLTGQMKGVQKSLSMIETHLLGL